MHENEERRMSEPVEFELYQDRKERSGHCSQCSHCEQSVPWSVKDTVHVNTKIQSDKC